jgi:hypothetical protein
VEESRVNLLDKRYKKSSSMVGRSIEDEVILVPIRNNIGDLQNMYVLNKVGGFIWQCIDGNTNGHEIKAKIIDRFEVSDNKAESDVSLFLHQLKEIGAITSVN